MASASALVPMLMVSQAALLQMPTLVAVEPPSVRAPALMVSTPGVSTEVPANSVRKAVPDEPRSMALLALPSSAVLMATELRLDRLVLAQPLQVPLPPATPPTMRQML